MINLKQKKPVVLMVFLINMESHTRDILQRNNKQIKKILINQTKENYETIYLNYWLSIFIPTYSNSLYYFFCKFISLIEIYYTMVSTLIIGIIILVAGLLLRYWIRHCTENSTLIPMDKAKLLLPSVIC